MRNKKLLQKSLVIIIVSLALLAGAIYVIFFYPRNPTTTYSPKYPESIVPQKDTDLADQDKQQAANISPATSEEVPVSNKGTVVISDLQQKDGFVNALATTSDFDVKTCVYSFTSDGARPVVKEQANGCSGVSIPQVEFEKIGLYTLTVTAYNAEEKISTTKEVSVR